MARTPSVTKIRQDDFKTVLTNNMIKAYAPQVFKYIRFMDGVYENEIIKSLDPKSNRLQIFKTNKGTKHNDGGKSGSFFFFSQDKKYIIKTLFPKEKIRLLDMLPQMVKFIHENKVRSVMSRIYGIYRIKLPGVEPVDVILQKNAMECQPGNVLIEKFDLKGSLFKRFVISNDAYDAADYQQHIAVSPADASRSLNKQSYQQMIDLKDTVDGQFYSKLPEKLRAFLIDNKETLKDMDYLKLSKRHGALFAINISDRDRAELIEMIENDVKFLSDNYLMDYSMLIGIELVNR